MARQYFPNFSFSIIMSKSQMDICRNLQGVPALDAKMEGTQNSQNNLEKEQIWKIHTP
jgi:hypothetical protein